MEYIRLHEDPGSTERGIAMAADALRRGSLALLPTETVYGIFASAASPEATARLAELTFPRGPAAQARYRYTWHAPSVETIFASIPIPHPRHRLLMRRLLPGPVRFDVPLGKEELGAALEGLAVPPGVIDEAGVVAIRVPSPDCTRGALEAAGVSVVANRAASAPGWGPDRDLSGILASGAAEAAGIAVALDLGPTMFGQPSTLVRLLPGGRYHVEPGGAYDSRMIEKRSRLRILFVCTGNTCRSPMAEAIARSVLAERGVEGVQLTIGSAGTSAAHASPASPATAVALRGLGIEPAEHRSRALTRQLIADSDVIFAMSERHLDEILALDPSAASRAMVLDPTGQDVPDPVGLPQDVYNRTALRLRDLVLQRLRELDILAETR